MDPLRFIIAPFQKGLSFPFKLNWKESLLIYFENFEAVPCSHRQSSNRMLKTFLIVNITPFTIVNIIPSLSLYFSTPFTDHCFILKVTKVFPYSYTGKVDRRMVNTLLMIKINPTCKRLLIFICQEKNRNLACITNKQVINC